MRMRCLGRDEDPVMQDDTVKSVSNEMSFAESISTRGDIERAIATMAAKVCRRLRKSGLKARTFALKIRYEDLRIRSAQIRLDAPSDDEFEVADSVIPLIDQLWSNGMLVRLVGVAATGFDDEREQSVQERLFALDPPNEEDEHQPHINPRHAELIAATDRIRDRFGERAVNFGRENATLDSATGSGSKNPEDYRKH